MWRKVRDWVTDPLFVGGVMLGLLAVEYVYRLGYDEGKRSC